MNDEEDWTCTVSPTCVTADVLFKATVIQWDEFPMAKRTSLDAVLRLLDDVRTARPNDFVAHVFVYYGDFRQIPPVLKHATRQ